MNCMYEFRLRTGLSLSSSRRTRHGASLRELPVIASSLGDEGTVLIDLIVGEEKA